MAVEDLQIWADHLETIRLPEIEADIADIQPRLSQAEADIVSKVQTINDTLTLHSARIDEAQVDADAAMDRANYALTRVYDQFIEANSNWMMALDALRDEFTYDLNSSTAAITDAYTNAILAQLSAATLKVQTQFDVKVAEVEGIKTTIDGIKANIDLDIDTLNNTILPGMNAEIDQLQLDTGTIAGDLTTLQSDLQTFYYSATDTETAIAGAITTAKSEIENPDGASLGATLAQSYRTSADQDAVTAAALVTLKSEIEDVNGTSLGATLSNNYLTTTNTNSAIAAAISTLKSQIEDPNGDSIASTLDLNYLTSTETNNAIASADQTLKSEIESPTGTIRSLLTSQYLTSTNTNTAIAGAVSTLKSEIEDEDGTSLGATLSNNYYTSTDTDAAISAEISTVQASINGVSANVTSVSNALADVEDNLAASYTLRVSADGASAGFEIVAADNPSGPASTIRMDADNILIDGTVTADHIDSRGLSIRDADNNIILAAGTPLSVSNVSGLGNLATQSSVSTSQVTGLGSLATQDTVGWTSVTGRPGSLADLDATAASQLDNKSVSYYQNSAPTGLTALNNGDIWFETDANYRMYTYQHGSGGNGWIPVQDSAAASAAAAAAQTTANKKITTYYENSTPTAPAEGFTVGDMWYSPLTKKLSRRSASGWVDVSNLVTNTTELTDGANLGSTAVWNSVSGSGKPADNATVGAEIGVNVTGQITASNISTLIAGAAIGEAYIADGVINARKLTVKGQEVTNLLRNGLLTIQDNNGNFPEWYANTAYPLTITAGGSSDPVDYYLYGSSSETYKNLDHSCFVYTQAGDEFAIKALVKGSGALLHSTELNVSATNRTYKIIAGFDFNCVEVEVNGTRLGYNRYQEKKTSAGDYIVLNEYPNANDEIFVKVYAATRIDFIAYFYNSAGTYIDAETLSLTYGGPNWRPIKSKLVVPSNTDIKSIQSVRVQRHVSNGSTYPGPLYLGNLELLYAGVAAEISTAAIDTLYLAGNAVTVPISQTVTNSITGNGSYKEIQWLNHTLEEPGNILIIFSGSQGYSSGNTPHSVQVRIDGSNVTQRGGYYVEDYPTLMYSGFFEAGTRRIAIWWQADSSVTFNNRTLSILGVKR